MSVFYSNFLRLCAEHGVKPSFVANSIGLSNAAATSWKNGKTPTPLNLEKLATFFGVSADSLLAETEKAPAESGERDIKAAFFDGMGLTEDEQDDLWQDAKEYFQFKIAQRKRKDGNR